MKVAKLTVVFCLCVLSVTPVLADEQIKHGILEENETWSGQIRLTGDVVIPKGKTLKIEPDTIILYEEKDVKNYGKNPNKPELVVFGDLDMPDAKSIGRYDVLKVDPKTRLIKIAPYKVDTAPLQQEFREFKEQYVVLWTSLTLGLILALIIV